ncbi:hypothetical protein DB346_16910 [Verrucomicrobia bacterium LW23]|nr:hypothetical protein DB346_16910 [Verrucomicrobia bacterium LW23]
MEVVLALGLAAFALTFILALMSVSLNSSKASSEDTVLATMSMAAINDLRRRPFSDVPGTADVSSTAIPVEVTYPIFFDVSGVRIKDAAGEDIVESDLPNYPGAVYRCNITLLGDPDTMSPVAGSPSLRAVNLLRVTLTFEWPLQAAAPNTRVIHATIARY